MARTRCARCWHRPLGRVVPARHRAEHAVRVGRVRGRGLPALLDLPYFVPHEWQQGHGQNVAARFGCTTLACLRDVPVADLLTAPVFPLPAYGNAVLPEDPAVAVPAGRFQHVPFLTGVTRDEGTLFAPPMFPGLTEEGYRQALSVHFGPKADAVAERYQSPRTGHRYRPSPRSWRPGLGVGAARRRPDVRGGGAGIRVQFLGGPPRDRRVPRRVEPLASHAAERVCSTSRDDRPLTAAQPARRRMIDYWARFATTGDPTSRASAVAPVDPAGPHLVRASTSTGSDRSTAPHCTASRSGTRWRHSGRARPRQFRKRRAFLRRQRFRQVAVLLDADSAFFAVNVRSGGGTRPPRPT
ncbi:carboxylesterase family protein [Saccharothrix sp. MB29]|nr:carboxylesterase family protein [Saccharothrix sp. MB29]